MDRNTPHIFISHRGGDDRRVEQLKGALEARGYDVRDTSVYENTEDRAAVEEQVRWAGTLIVIVSRLTPLAGHVHWEIDCAHRTNARIIGVCAEEQMHGLVPAGLRKYADAGVPWDDATICEAVEDRVRGWQCGDEKQRQPLKLPDIICRSKKR